MKNLYTKSYFDHCDYFKKLKDRSFIYLFLYINDILIASKRKVKIEELKVQLKNKFEIKELEETEKVLGMEIKSDRVKRLFVSEIKFVEGIEQKWYS